MMRLTSFKRIVRIDGVPPDRVYRSRASFFRTDPRPHSTSNTRTRGRGSARGAERRREPNQNSYSLRPLRAERNGHPRLGFYGSDLVLAWIERENEKNVPGPHWGYTITVTRVLEQ